MKWMRTLEKPLSLFLLLSLLLSTFGALPLLVHPQPAKAGGDYQAVNNWLDVSFWEQNSGSTTGANWLFWAFDTQAEEWNWIYSIYKEHFGVWTGDWGAIRVSDVDFTIDQYFSQSADGRTAILHYGDVQVTRQIYLPSGDAKYFNITYTLANTGSGALSDVRFFQTVDYDIGGAGGDYAWYSATTDSVWQNDDTYYKNGFGGSVPSATHGMDQWRTELDYDWSDGNLNGWNQYPDTGTEDVAVGMQWNMGDLVPGASWTNTIRFEFGERAGIEADAGVNRTVPRGTPVTLDASGSRSIGTITSYEWDIDNDGSYEVSTTSPTYTYSGWTDVGAHIVGLRVTDNASRQATDTVTITTGPNMDLVITSLTYSPTSDIVDGDTVNFTTTVENQGLDMVTTDFYIGWEVDNSLVNSSWVWQDLAPGGSLEVSGGWTATAGAEVATATADYYGYVSESNEGNNSLSADLSEIPFPDFSVTGGSFSPEADISDGNVIAFTGTVGNTGGDTSRGFYVALSIDSSPVDWQWIYGLASGETASIFLEWSATPGTHTAAMTADYYNYVPESSEENNSLSTALPEVLYPDLVISDLSFASSGVPALRVFSDSSWKVSDAEETGWTEAGFDDSSWTDAAAPWLYWVFSDLSPAEPMWYPERHADDFLWYFFRKTFTIPTDMDILLANLTIQVDDDYILYVNSQEVARDESHWTEAPSTYNVAPYLMPGENILAVAAIDSYGYNEGVNLRLDIYATGGEWNVGEGDTLTFVATVENIGEGDTSRDFLASLLVDEGWADWEWVNGLASGESQDILLTWNASAGSHTAEAIADQYNYVAESNEDNNDLSAALPEIPFPDLTITDITWSPQEIRDGDTVVFTAAVENVGEGRLSQDFYVGFEIDGTLVGAPLVSIDLAPGEATEVSQSWRATGGVHTVSATADWYGQVSEANEENNDLSAALPEIPFPDLTITSFTMSPTENISDGDEVLFTATVENTGVGDTTAGFYVSLQIPDVWWTSEWITGGLAADETVEVSGIWTAQPPGAPLNALATVDYTQYITESDESNNQMSLDLPTIPYPDLVITDITWPPEQILPDNRVDFQATVENQGEGDTSGDFYVAFFVDDDFVGLSQVSGGLASGEEATVHFPWIAEEGSHIITAIADYYNQVGEAGEGAAPPSLSNTRIAFTSDRDDNYEVYVMDVDGADQTRLTINSAADEDPAWSPDGEKITFHSDRDGNYEIWLMNADGSVPTQLTHTDYPVSNLNPSWSPDGSKIAFDSNQDGNYEIYVMDADGSHQTRLTTDLHNDAYPAWSPEGSEIAFVSDREGNLEIYVMDADGSHQTPLTADPASDLHPAWSPDGNKIAFASDREGNLEIYVMDADGSHPTRLTDSGAADQEPSWSPDGSKIAFSSDREGNWEVYVMDADGSSPANLTNDSAREGRPRWSPFFLANNNRLWEELPPVPLRPRVTTTFPNGSEIWYGTQNITWQASSPDGRGLVIQIDLYNGSYHNIVRDYPNTGSFSWDTTSLADGSPVRDSNYYMVRVKATDTLGVSGSDLSDNWFTIWNTPQVELQVFPGGILTAEGETALYTFTITNKQPQADTFDLSIDAPYATLAELSQDAITLDAWASRTFTLELVYDSEVGIYASVAAVSQTAPEISAQVTVYTYALPSFVISLSPSSAETSLGGTAIYYLTLTNNRGVADTFDLSIVGIDSSWYSLPESVTMASGETRIVPLSISVPASASAGDFNFTAQATSHNLGTSRWASAYLSISAEPLLYDLAPADYSRTGSTDVVVSWRTSVPSSATVYYKPQEETDYTSETGEPGIAHGIILGDLERNSWYEFYVESSSEFTGATAQSPVRRFLVDNGITFSQRTYSAAIQRDYDQRVYIMVSNTDDEPHQLLVSVSGVPSDLIVGFVGEGSQDQSILLQPGESHWLTLAIHAQDAQAEEYSFPLTLTNLGAEPITDQAYLNLNVHIPFYDFTLEEIASDPVTLTKTFRITNNGDPLTDLSLELSPELSGLVMLQPSIRHGAVWTGQSLTFKAMPVLTLDYTSAAGSLFARAAGQVTSLDVDFSLPEGKSVFIGHAPTMSIDFAPEFDTDGIANTNPDDQMVNSYRIDLRGLDREEATSFLAQAKVKVLQDDQPAYQAEVRLEIWSTGLPATLYATTDLWGNAVFTFSGPVDEYSYKASIVGYPASTETRYFSVNPVPTQTLAPLSIDWVAAADSAPGSTYDLTDPEVTQITLDTPLFTFQATKEGLSRERDAVAILYLNHSANYSGTEIIGEIEGETITFTLGSIDPGTYTATIATQSTAEIATSAPRTIIFTGNASDPALQPEYTYEWPFPVDAESVAVVSATNEVVESTEGKIVQLLFVTPSDETETPNTQYLFTYVIVADRTMDDTLIATVKDAQDNVLYESTQAIHLEEGEPLFIDVPVPVYDDEGERIPEFRIEVVTLDRSKVVDFIKSWTTDPGGIFDGETWKIFWQNGVLTPQTRTGVVVKCFAGFVPGVGTVTGVIDLVNNLTTLKDPQTGEIDPGKAWQSVLGAGQLSLDPLMDWNEGTNRLRAALRDWLPHKVVEELIAKTKGLPKKEQFFKLLQEYADAVKLAKGWTKIVPVLGWLTNLYSNYDDWKRVTDTQPPNPSGVSSTSHMNDWYCTNRPVIDTYFDMPPSIPDMVAASAPVPNVTQAYLIMRFTLPWSPETYYPHDVHVLLNGTEIGTLSNTVPNGSYLFPFDASLLRYGENEVASNTITLDTRHLNPGHYVISSDFRIVLGMRRVDMAVVASSQAEADALVRSLSSTVANASDFALYPENIVLSPAQPRQGDPVDVEATVFNLGTTGRAGVPIQFLDNGVEFWSGSISYLPGLSSTTVTAIWAPEPGYHILSAKVNANQDMPERDYANNAATLSLFVPGADVIAPAISNPQPSPDATISEDTPLITADLSDADSGINTAAVAIVLDNVDVTPDAGVTASRVWFIPATPLAQGEHTVQVYAEDNSGNSATLEWSFTTTVTGEVEGIAILQGRSEHSGALATFTSEEEGEAGIAATDVLGVYSTSLVQGTYDVSVTMAGYLTAHRTGVQIAVGELTLLPPVLLRGGDINGDAVVDAADLAALSTYFNTIRSEDINGDAIVDVYDLALAGINYGETESPWAD